MKQLIYKPTQNRKTYEIILNILEHIGQSINIVFTDNLCMLGSQTSDRIIKEIEGVTLYRTDDIKTISIHCESNDIEGVSRKQIATHIYGLICHDGVRNIITLTNSVRLPQIKDLINILLKEDSFGRDPVVPTNIPIINLYFDEADKTIKSIRRGFRELLDNEFIDDFYITATPKKVLKIYGEMKLYPVLNTLDNYINLQYANWIDIGNEEYLDSLRMMLNIIKGSNTRIHPSRFIFAPGIIRKDSHYEIAEESTNVFDCISIIVNSDGLNILLPSSINDKYLSSVTNNRGVNVPLLPDKLKESFNKRCWNNILKISGGERYYQLNFNKKLLINDNDNEFWKVVETIRMFWTDNPILITGSRCVERGITIQNPFNKNIRFTDGMLHCNISRSDSGAQMAGRFTLTYNDDINRSDFVPINIYSNEKTRMFMINQEKKAIYAVELSNKGKEQISYDEWKGYERRSVLGHEEFDTFLEAIRYSNEKFTYRNVNYNPNKDYNELSRKLGSCNLIEEGEFKGFRYNSFDNKEKVPIDKSNFNIRCTRHLCWREGKEGNVYRIWAVYDDIKYANSLKYHVCYTPLALHDELNESDSESDSDL